MRARLDPAQFWRCTLREVALILEERAYADAERHNELMRAAWNTAALTRTKRMPDIKTLMMRVGPAKPRRQQSTEEQIAAATAWAASTR